MVYAARWKNISDAEPQEESKWKESGRIESNRMATVDHENQKGVTKSK